MAHKEITHNKLNIFLYFMRKYQWRTGVLLLIQFFIGFLEGVGIAALLPLITIMVEGTGQTESPLYAMVAGLFSAIHLDLKLESVLLVIVVIFGLKAVLKFFGSWYVAYLGSKVVHDMRTDLLDALLHSRWSFYVQRPVGMFVNSLMVESQRSGGAFRTMIDMIAAFLQMGLLLFIASLAAWEVVAIAAMTGAFLWVALYRYIVITGKTSIAQKDLSRSISVQITDILQNYKPLKAMRIEDGVFKRMEKDITLLFDVSREQIMAKQKMEIMYEPIFVTILSAGLYGALTYLAIAPAVLMVMAALFYRIITSARELQQSVQVLSGQESFFWALHDFTQDAKTARENYVEGRRHVLGQEVSFEGVSFAYESKPILSGIGLKIPAKKLVGIHGPSGTGKTTLIDLLCRLYTPDEGRILVDGLPLEEIDLHHWRGSIGYVPQEFVVFNDTISGNLTFGNPDITEEQVIEALKKAEAWGFISEMPEGLNTNLGERGGRLSGGQRQRISIARALVRNPSLLILDEATASLDPVTEKEIYKTLKALSKEMTIIAISHQNTMKEYADQVIDLKQL